MPAIYDNFIIMIFNIVCVKTFIMIVSFFLKGLEILEGKNEEKRGGGFSRRKILVVFLWLAPFAYIVLSDF